jgi:hypothetical protein
MNNLKKSFFFLLGAVLLTFGINRNAVAQTTKTGAPAPGAQQQGENGNKKTVPHKTETSRTKTGTNASSGVVVKAKEMKKQAGTTTKVEKATREKASSTK